MVSESDILNGTIFKDTRLLYENQTFKVGRQTRIPDSDALNIYVYDNNKPIIHDNDCCRLVLKDGRQFEINVAETVQISSQMHIITFYLKAKS